MGANLATSGEDDTHCEKNRIEKIRKSEIQKYDYLQRYALQLGD